jgi:ATP-dependent Clp protease ATP-binding subunit ClpC
MFENFTERSLTVMQLAEDEARRLKYVRIRSEHILLGLASDDTGLAAYALRYLGADKQKIQREVDKVSRAAAAAAPEGAIPLAADSERVIQYAWEEARSMHHNQLGTEHILLGLLQEDRGLALQILANLHVDPDAVRLEVRKLLGHGF